jgi:hypothetical protein
MEVINAVALFFVFMGVLIIWVHYMEDVVNYVADHIQLVMLVTLIIGGDFMLASLVNLVR